MAATASNQRSSVQLVWCAGRFAPSTVRCAIDVWLASTTTVLGWATASVSQRCFGFIKPLIGFL